MNNQSRLYTLTAEFLDALRTEKRLMGVDKHLQIQTLLSQLPEDTDVDTLKWTLIPLIAQSPQEQEQLYTVFEQAVKRVEEKGSIALPESGDNTTTATTVTPNFPKVKNFWKVIATAAAIVMLLTIGGGLWWETQQNKPNETPKQVDSTQISPNDTLNIAQKPQNTEGGQISYFVENKPYPFPDHLEKYSLKPPSPTQEWLSNNWAWLRWVLAVVWMGILLAIWRYLAWKRRKLIAKQDPNDKPPYIWNINLEGIAPVLMGDSLDRVTQMLRNRAQSETQQIDMPKTVNATIEHGGLPTFNYKQATRPTDYLLLIDRQTVRNHRAKLFDSLYEVFKAQEVEIARFFYDSDVRVCYSEDYPHGIALADVQQRYYQSRLLIVGTGGQLLNPMSGKVAAWTAVFNQWKDRALFSPKPLKSWGYDERQLSALFTTLPATLQGLGFWVEEVNTGADARFDDWQDKIDDVPNAPIIPDDHDPVPMLNLYFEPMMVKWIAACAIYPTLHWDLTLWLGQQMSFMTPTFGELSKFPERNPEHTPLSTFANIMQICRLSWFVNGEMPYETRIALLQYLEQNDAPLLRRLRGAIAEELQKNPPPKDSAAYDTFRLHIALNEWLSTTDTDKKKELEQEVTNLLAQGAEPDFTVLKYLNTPRTPLDFVVPEAWKKFVHPSGFAALGWLKAWKDLVWVLPLVLVGLIGIFYPYKFETFDCSKDKIAKLTTKEGKTYYFCLDDIRNYIVYEEQLIRDKIINHQLSVKDGYYNYSYPIEGGYTYNDDLPILINIRDNNQNFISLSPNIPFGERRKNFAVDFYKLAEDFYKNNQNDSACYYLNLADRYDNLDTDIQRARRDLCGIKPSVNTVFEQDYEPYKENNLYGYRNRKTKKNLIPPQYPDAHNFMEGLAAVKQGKTWGFIDTKNTMVIAPQFGFAYGFAEGMCLIADNTTRFGYIDKTGKIQIPPQYEMAERFKNGIARVKNKVNDRWFCIDKTGKTVDCAAQAIASTPSVSTPKDSNNVTILVSANQDKTKPTLRVLSIGVPTHHIQYSSKDASDFASVFNNNQEGGIYNKIVINLHNREVNTTKQKIKQEFD